MSQWTQLVSNHQAVASDCLREGVSAHNGGVTPCRDHPVNTPEWWPPPPLNNMTQTPIWGNAPRHRETGE